MADNDSTQPESVTLASSVIAINNLGESERREIVNNSGDFAHPRSITNWKAVPATSYSIGNGTLGIVKVSATVDIAGELTPWTAVVKVIGAQTWGDAEIGKGNTALREIAAYKSELFSALESGMTAAPSYGVGETEEGTVWLWLKDLTGVSQAHWRSAEYLTAARHIGQFNGLFPEARAPKFDWLDRSGITDMRYIYSMYFASTFERLIENIDHPYVIRVASIIGTKRMSQLMENALLLLQATSTFPRSIAHNDCNTRNLFKAVDENQNPKTYAIDWATVGHSPVGVDAGQLIASDIDWRDEDALLVAEIEQEIFEEYVKGLGDSGWDGNTSQVRIAFISSIASRVMGLALRAQQLTQNDRWAERALTTSGVGIEETLDQTAERLALFLPLVDEGLQLTESIRK